MADVPDTDLEVGPAPVVDIHDPAPVVGLNPVHNAPALCGVASAAARRTFLYD